MSERIYALPGFPALLMSLALVVLLIVTAAGITWDAAAAREDMATATPLGSAPTEVAAWVEWQTPRRR